MSIDGNVAFEYSIKKKENGEPFDFNNVYTKIKNDNYFLNPYTTWCIQLKKDTSDFSIFNSLKNEIMDIQLIGDGEYLKRSTSFIRGYFHFHCFFWKDFFFNFLHERYLLSQSTNKINA